MFQTSPDTLSILSFQSCHYFLHLSAKVDLFDQPAKYLLVYASNLPESRGELVVPLTEQGLLSVESPQVLDVFVMHDAPKVPETASLSTCSALTLCGDHVDEPNVLLLKHAPGRTEHLRGHVRELVDVMIDVQLVSRCVFRNLLNLVKPLNILLKCALASPTSPKPAPASLGGTPTPAICC